MSLPPPPEDPHALKPGEIGGPGRLYFNPPAVDGLMDAVMELSAELWALKDRQYVMERVLAEQGLTDRIEQWRASPEDVAERKALREAFIARIFNGFMRGQAAPPPARD